MIVLRKGSVVPFPNLLEEAYEQQKYNIVANISADKIKMIMEDFIKIQEEPLFFIIELPSNRKDEKEIKPGVLNNFHKDVYYIDGCTKEETLSILNDIGNIMINDGFCEFGFASHITNDEIMFCKYNVTVIYSKDCSKYQNLLEKYKICKINKLVTAWDTFSQDHPGESYRIKTGGKDIYSIPKKYKKRGMYKAEQREE